MSTYDDLWHTVCDIDCDKMAKRLTADGWDILHEPYNGVEFNRNEGVLPYHKQIDARIEFSQYLDESAEQYKVWEEEQRVFKLTFHTVEEPLRDKIKRRIAKR